MKLQLLRNATLRLSYGGHELLIDPMFGDKHSLPSFAGREENPTAALNAAPQDILRGVELLVVSHLHPDHFDSAAQQQIAKDLPVLCQPNEAQAIEGMGFTQVTELQDNYQWQNLSFRRTHGEHGSGPILTQMGAAMGFVLSAQDEPMVYWLGDTVLIDAVLDTIKQVKPDVIVTHSGGATIADTLLIMDAAQTVQVAQAAPEAVVVAVHLESLDHCLSSRADLRQAADAAGIAPTRLLIPADGETLTLS